MFDQTNVVVLVGALSSPKTVVRYCGNMLNVALYKARTEFLCHSKHAEMMLMPIALHMRYSGPVHEIHQPDIELLDMSIICTTRHSTSTFIGKPVCMFASGFEIFGRLRRAICEQAYKPLTMSSYVEVALTTINKPPKCRAKNAHQPAAKWPSDLL